MLKIIFGQKTTHLFYIGSIQAFGTASAVFPANSFLVQSLRFKVQGYIIFNFEP